MFAFQLNTFIFALTIIFITTLILLMHLSPGMKGNKPMENVHNKSDRRVDDSSNYVYDFTNNNNRNNNRNDHFKFTKVPVEYLFPRTIYRREPIYGERLIAGQQNQLKDFIERQNNVSQKKNDGLKDYSYLFPNPRRAISDALTETTTTISTFPSSITTIRYGLNKRGPQSIESQIQSLNQGIARIDLASVDYDDDVNDDKQANDYSKTASPTSRVIYEDESREKYTSRLHPGDSNDFESGEPFDQANPNSDPNEIREKEFQQDDAQLDRDNYATTEDPNQDNFKKFHPKGYSPEQFPEDQREFFRQPEDINEFYRELPVYKGSNQDNNGRKIRKFYNEIPDDAPSAELRKYKQRLEDDPNFKINVKKDHLNSHTLFDDDPGRYNGRVRRRKPKKPRRKPGGKDCNDNNGFPYYPSISGVQYIDDQNLNLIQPPLIPLELPQSQPQLLLQSQPSVPLQPFQPIQPFQPLQFINPLELAPPLTFEPAPPLTGAQLNKLRRQLTPTTEVLAEYQSLILPVKVKYSSNMTSELERHKLDKLFSSPKLLVKEY